MAELSPEQQQELYAERLRTYKQLEADITAMSNEMYQVFKKQQAEVSKYEGENRQLGDQVLQLDQ